VISFPSLILLTNGIVFTELTTNLKTFYVDYGSWEKGHVLEVEAENYRQAMTLADVEADERPEVSGVCVQVHDKEGKVLWDYWNGSIAECEKRHEERMEA